MNIRQALRSPRVFKSAYGDLETWKAWGVFLSAIYGLPIKEGAELELFRRATGLETPPAGPVREVFCVSGRRSGKSRTAALLAVWMSTFQDWSKVLGPGERGKAFLVAVDRQQAMTIRDYVSGFVHASSYLESQILAEGKEIISLKTGVDIEVATANYRSIRGRTCVFACMEELAFWRASETYANPAKEVYTALKPSLATVPGGLLMGISTAYARSGLLWEMVQRHHGKPGSTLVWVSDSLTMNPGLSKEMIDSEIEADPSAARAEWLSVFRDDVESFVGIDLLQSAITPGQGDIPLEHGAYAVGFIDPSGGRHDSYTAGVASKERSGKVVLNAVRETRPPFSPEATTAAYAEFFKKYGVSEIVSDRWGGEWVCEMWRCNHSITVKPAEQTASDLYLSFLALLSSGKIELPDNPRLTSQFLQLERRVRPGGRDQVSHPPGLHDDLCNAASGALVLASKEETGICVGSPNINVWPEGSDRYEEGGGIDEGLRRMLRGAEKYIRRR